MNLMAFVAEMRDKRYIILTDSVSAAYTFDSSHSKSIAFWTTFHEDLSHTAKVYRLNESVLCHSMGLPLIFVVLCSRFEPLPAELP